MEAVWDICYKDNNDTDIQCLSIKLLKNCRVLTVLRCSKNCFGFLATVVSILFGLIAFKVTTNVIQIEEEKNMMTYFLMETSFLLIVSILFAGTGSYSAYFVSAIDFLLAYQVIFS